MSVVLFLKSQVKGYTRKDGVVVAPHSTKVVKKVEQIGGLTVTHHKAKKMSDVLKQGAADFKSKFAKMDAKDAADKAKKKAGVAQFDHKAPLPDDAYAGVEKPVEQPVGKMTGLFKEKLAASAKANAKPAKSEKPAQAALFPSEKNGPTGWPFKTEKKWDDKKTAGHKQAGLFGTPTVKPSYPHAVTHPQPGENGKPFQINEPSHASAPETWTDPAAIALFVPGGVVPDALNGVSLTPWTDHPQTDAGWNYVDGQMHDLDEPELDLKGKAPAAGVIIQEPDGRYWVVRPSNGFAGYKATFPKGHADDGMSLQASAIKECFEEAGLKVEITGFLGDVERGQTTARYYSARRVGGTPTACGWETQGVALVPAAELHAYLNTSVDRKVAKLAGVKAPPGLFESADDWDKVGKQAGSNPGGVYKDENGQAWYVKLPKSSSIARNEVLAARLYEAAGVKVPELKHVMVGDKLGIASKMVDGVKKDEAALKAGTVPGVMEGFAVDAWLANWDAVGLLYDNLLVGPDGDAVRIDVGGSLVFRAQGEPKGKAFGDKVGELQTLIDGKNPQATAVFKGITPEQLHAGIAKVAAVSDDTIRALVKKCGPGDSEQRKALAERIIARRDHLAGMLGETSA